jgi:hypothetical protein
VDGARLELAFHGCRPRVIPLYEAPNWGEMRESNSRDWSHNPAPKPFGQSRHRTWSCWLDSHQHRPAYKAGAFVYRPQQPTFGAGTQPRTAVGRLPCACSSVELYQRSWRGDSNADHGLTRPLLRGYATSLLIFTTLGRARLPVVPLRRRTFRALVPKISATPNLGASSESLNSRHHLGR